MKIDSLGAMVELVKKVGLPEVESFRSDSSRDPEMKLDSVRDAINHFVKNSGALVLDISLAYGDDGWSALVTYVIIDLSDST